MGDTETFGQRLRRLRREAGLTQRDLAGDHIDASYVSLLEKDRRDPTHETVDLLARVLGCSPQYLREGTSDSQETLLLARAELGLGNFAEAIDLLEPLVARISYEPISQRLDFSAAEIYATALERSGDIVRAIDWLERLRDVAEADPRGFPTLRVGLALVRCHRDAGDFMRAIQVGERATAIYKELGLAETSEYGVLVATLALLYANAGDSVYATTLLEDLAATGERTGDPKTQAYAYWNAAITATQQGRPAEGQYLIDRATALLDSTDDLRNRSRIRSTRATLLLRQSPPDPLGAREILLDELPRLAQHNGVVSIARVEIELARCELMLGRPDEARRLAAASLDRLPAAHRVERADAGAVHAAALVAGGEVDSGLVEFEQSIQVLINAGAKGKAAATLRELAAIHQSMGDLSAAFECSQRALSVLGVVPTYTPAALLAPTPSATECG